MLNRTCNCPIKKDFTSEVEERGKKLGWKQVLVGFIVRVGAFISTLFEPLVFGTVLDLGFVMTADGVMAAVAGMEVDMR